MNKKFIKNTILLTTVTLIIRIISMAFRVSMASKIGAEGIGLYQLVLTAYMFAVTVTTSGITLAVTRIVTDCIALNEESKAKSAANRCLIIGLCISCFCAGFLFFFAEQIGRDFLNEPRTVLAIKTLAPSLPFMAISACYRGYFYAKRTVIKTAGEQLIEQIVEIAVFFILVESMSKKGLEYAVASIAIGTTASEIISCIYSYICYYFEIRKTSFEKALPLGFRRKLFSILIPVTASSCLRSGLSSVENAMIPSGLKKYGLNSEKALSDYGIITGMVMPVLLFPSFILFSVANLIIPEISEAKAVNNITSIREMCYKAYRLTFLFVIPVMVMFFVMGDNFGLLFYNSKETGFYISLLSPIIPLMYFDSITDGLLKGLNHQVSYLTYNIIDSVVRVLLVLILIPIMGIKGMIIVIFVSEILNTGLSAWKLITVTQLQIDVMNNILKPFAFSIAAGAAVMIIKPFCANIPILAAVLIQTAMFIMIYLMLSPFLKEKEKSKPAVSKA